jgi:hypothetical protein
MPCSARSVLLAELVDATAGVDDLLLARVERVAVGADFNLQIVPERRPRQERVTAAAADGGLFVLRVDSGFHDLLGDIRPLEKGAQCSGAHDRSQGKWRSPTAFQLSPRRCPEYVGGLSTKAVDNSVDGCLAADRDIRRKQHIVTLVNF